MRLTLSSTAAALAAFAAAATTTSFQIGPSSSTFFTVRKYHIATPLRIGSVRGPSLLKAKKNRRSKSGKGFGKKDASAPLPSPYDAVEAASDISFPPLEASSAAQMKPQGLTGISDAAPPSAPLIDSEEDPSVRQDRILREKFGLRSVDERMASYNEQDRKEGAAKGVAQKLASVGEDKDFDIFAVIPDPLLLAIDKFLKGGLAVTSLAFIAGGIGICVEAWSKATGNVLPVEMDDFIVNVIEPNFTPGLLVLLGFSISLGIFAGAQLGSASSQYKE